ESPGTPADYFVNAFETRGDFSPRFDHAGIINANSCNLWFTQPDDQEHNFGRSFNEVPVIRIDRCAAHSDQELIVARSRLFNLVDLQIGQPVVAINGGLHRIGRNGGVTFTVVSRGPI